MKSIIEEGNSIAKAVEKAWERAEKPTDFTIKIFQLPQKNFFGFTKVSAKIAIFFQDSQNLTEKPNKNIKTAEVRSSTKEVVVEKQPASPTNPSSEWTPDLCEMAQTWLYTALKKMEKGNITITLKPQRHILKIQFSENLINGSSEEERRFFGNLSHLMLSSLRTQAQLPLRNLQVSMRKLQDKYAKNI